MRSPPIIPKHFYETSPSAFYTNLQTYEKYLVYREGKLNYQAQDIESQLSLLEGKLSKHKNLYQLLKDTENYLITKYEQLGVLQTKLSELEYRCISLTYQNEVLQQTLTNYYASLRIREGELNQRQLALYTTLNEAEKMRLESESERQKFANLNSTLLEQQNLLSYQQQNVQILEHKMRECIRYSEEKTQYAEIQRIESERLMKIYGERNMQIEQLRSEFEQKKSKYDKIIADYYGKINVYQQVGVQDKEETETERYLVYYYNVAANLLAENKRLKSKIESIEAKIVVLADAPKSALSEEPAYEQQKEHNSRIEDAFRIKENELNKLIQDAREIRRQAELDRIRADRLEGEQIINQEKLAKSVYFATATYNLSDLAQSKGNCTAENKIEALESQSLSLPDPETLTLRKTQLSKFAPTGLPIVRNREFSEYGVADDLEVAQLAAYSRAADVSLTTYVRGAEEAVNKAVREVDGITGDLSQGKFKV